MKKIFFCLSLTATLYAVPPTPIDWSNGSNTHLWGNSGDWVGGVVPNSPMVQAVFPANANPPFFVTVNSAFTINSLLFPTFTQNYTLQTGGTLSFATSGVIDNPTIIVESNQQTISSVTLNFLAPLTVTIDPFASLSLNNLTFTGNANALTLNGGGSLKNNNTGITNLSSLSISNLTVSNLNSSIHAISGNANISQSMFTNTNSTLFGVGGSINLTNSFVVNDTNSAIGTTTALNITDSIVINSNNSSLSQYGTGINVNSGFVFNETGSTIARVPTLNIFGGIVNNEATASITQVGTLNISGGRLNNFAGASIINVGAINITGGTLYNEAPITSAIGPFTITNGTYEVGVFSPTNRGTISSSAVTLGSNLLVNLSPGFTGFGTPIEIIHSTAAITTMFARERVVQRGVGVDVSYTTNDVSIVLFPVATDFLFEFDPVIFGIVDHINYRIERELVRVRQRLCCGCNCNVFGGFIGSQGNFSPNDRFDFDFSTVGGLVGVDCAICNWGFGGLINYERLENDRHNNFTIDHLQGNLFATYVPCFLPGLAFEGIVGFGYEWWDLDRGSFFGRSHSNTNAWEWDVLVGAEYTLNYNRCFLSVPYATLQYVRLDIDRFHESGAAGFRVDNRDLDSLRSVLGVRFLRKWGCFLPEIDIGYLREYFSNDERISAIPLSAPAFASSVRRRDFNRNFLLLSADVTAAFCGRYSIEASYDLEWNNQLQYHTYYAGANMRF